MKLRDKLWLWGQNPGSHHASGHYRLPGVNKMDSAAGCDFFGIRKCYRVCMKAGPFPPFDAESEKLRHLPEVVWSAVGAGSVERCNEGLGDLPEVLRQAELFPNVSGAILDDFFASVEGFETCGNVARHSTENVKIMREKLHNFPSRRLNFHLVVYTYQLGLPIFEYLELFDVFTLWTWKACDLPAFPENLKKFKAMIPAAPVMAGCYLWNYGESKPLDSGLMKTQLDYYLEGLKNKDLDGVIVCSNCCADVGLETVGMMKEWIETYGDLEI